ncbi:MAG: ABC transporter permease [bacterium]|nr:ABC transporter permease [bacterium]
MRIRDSVTTAIGSLRTNATRAVLTILGIVIGITAIILVMALGRGAQELILDQVRAFGSESIFIEPGREPHGPADFAEIFTDSLTPRDVAALERPGNVQDLEYLSPLVAQVATVAYESETYRAQLRGASEHFPEILDVVPATGTFFSRDDVERRASVAVIGAKVADELFGSSDAVGAQVKVKGRPFRVVGVIARKGEASFIPYDELVVVPVTTAQKYLLGIDHYHVIAARARTGANVDRVKEEITLTLREQHGITDPEKDDFHVSTQQDAIDRIGVIATALTALLTALAAISLVVGGVGIMNIMLVAVAERTREIGLRKAIGARDADIRRQFLLESIILTVAGGIIGVAIGATLAFFAAFALRHTVATGWSFTFPVFAALLGIGVSAAIGLIFGLYPAQKAARKSPIEALRYE